MARKINFKFKVEGDVRGFISNHVKLSAAVKALIKDQNDCGGLGGGSYSDAMIIEIATNQIVDLEAEGYVTDE